MNSYFEIFETNDEDIYEIYLVNDANEIIDGPCFEGSHIDCEDYIINNGQLNVYYY